MIKSSYNKSYAALKMTMLSLFAVSVLAGCGIRGPLKTPPPLFGGDVKVDSDSAPNESLDQAEDDEDDFFELDVENQDSLADF